MSDDSNAKFDAFLSYARVDDESAVKGPGDISRFHEALQIQLRQKWKRNCSIFIDREIRSGQRWRDVLGHQLNEASFMVAMISPSFFESDECRAEVNAFRDLAEGQGVEARIFPILVEKVNRVKQDDFYKEVMARNFANFAPVRFKPSDSNDFRMFVATVADDIVDRLDAPPGPVPKAIAEYEAELQAKDAVLAGHVETVRGHQQRYEALQAEYDEARASLVDRIRIVEESYASLQAKFDETQRAAIPTIAELNRELQNKDAAIAALEEKVRGLGENCASLQVDRYNIREEAKKAVSGLEQALQVKDAYQATLQMDAENLEKKNTALEAERDRLRGDVRKLEDEIRQKAALPKAAPSFGINRVACFLWFNTTIITALLFRFSQFFGYQDAPYARWLLPICGLLTCIAGAYPGGDSEPSTVPGCSLGLLILLSLGSLGFGIYAINHSGSWMSPTMRVLALGFVPMFSIFLVMWALPRPKSKP